MPNSREYMREYKRAQRKDPAFVAMEKSRRNPEVSRRATRKYLAKNPDHVRNWRSANREQARGQVLLRRARIADVDHGCVTPDFLKLIYSLPCVYCGAACEHADHVIPVSRHGLHCVENIQPSCSTCNTTKGTRILDNAPTPIAECEVMARG